MKAYSLLTFLVLLLLSACGTIEVSLEETMPTAASPLGNGVPAGVTAIPRPTRGHVIAAYVRDGDVLVWDELTGQSKTVFASGDVTKVSMSDDGQIIALVRRAEAGVALWAVEANGKNPRELVSPEAFRKRLAAVAREEAEPMGSGIGELEWIPRSHRLLYNWTIQGGSGDYWASPEIYLLDIDIRADRILARGVLLGPVKQLDIVPSPDGRQLALITGTGLHLINSDGSDRRDSVLAYPAVGVSSPPILMSTGAWTQDSGAFVITGSMEMDAAFNTSFAIWRVPVDRSSPEVITPLLHGRPDSVTFSPDGQYVAFQQNTEGSRIAPLDVDAGPLALPERIEVESSANLHWSPAGDVFTRHLWQLCPNATRDSEVCDLPFNTYDAAIGAIQWIDETRLLFLTTSPSVLFLSMANGPTIPIVAIADSFDAAVVMDDANIEAYFDRQ